MLTGFFKCSLIVKGYLGADLVLDTGDRLNAVRSSPLNRPLVSVRNHPSILDKDYLALVICV